MFKDIVKRVNKREDYVEENLRIVDEKEIIKRIIDPYGSLIKDKKEDKKTEKNISIEIVFKKLFENPVSCIFFHCH